MYDPSIGRWLSEDPSGFDGGDPNLYRYVGNSPTNFTDATGLSLTKPYANLPKLTPTGPAVNLAGGLGSYSTPKAADRYFFDQGLNNLLNPSTLTTRGGNFTTPTQEQIFDAQLNPHGKPVKIETIESTVWGDKLRIPAQELSTYSRPEIATRSILAGLIDTVFPPSAPSRFVTYADGSHTLYDNEGPSSQSLADFATLAIGGGPRVAPRPGGQGVRYSNKIRFVDESSTKYGYAQNYEDAATGARSNVATGLRQVPVLERRLPNGTTSPVRFDGVEDAVLIDRKVSVTTFHKSRDQAIRQSEAL